MPLSPTNWGAGSSGSGSGFSQGAAWSPSPLAHKYLAWSYDLIHADSTGGSALGTAVFTRIDIPQAITVASLVAYVANNLTGVPTFVGAALYDGSGSQSGSGVGQRLATTADQSASWNTNGEKTMALTVDAGKSLSFVGGLGVWVYAAFLTAGGAGNPTSFSRFNQAGRNNLGLAAADGFRFGQLAGQANLPTSIALNSLADATSIGAWAAIK